MVPKGDSEVQRALLQSQNHSSERDQTKGGQKWRAEQMSHTPGLAGVGYLGEDIQSLTPLWQLCALVRTAQGQFCHLILLTMCFTCHLTFSWP